MTLLAPEGARYLFQGYGTPGQEVAEIPAALADHLTGAGFAVDLRRGPGVAGVVATQRPGQPS